MGNKDLERLNNVDESRLGHGLVCLRFLEGLESLDILDEDDVVFTRLLALVVDLGLLGGALHIVGFCGWLSVGLW